MRFVSTVIVQVGCVSVSSPGIQACRCYSLAGEMRQGQGRDALVMKRVSRVAAAVLAASILAIVIGCSSGGSASSASTSTASSSASSTSASTSASASVASASSASASIVSSSADSASAQAAVKGEALENGKYIATFKTDSSMFHVNESKAGKGELTVADGNMTIHVSLASKKIVNVYAGTAAQANEDSANVIQPTTDAVTYSDGYEEEVYGFDIPVPALDQEFDVAILGEKGTWYDHKVSVSNPVKE